jgi:hypothetical protein
LFKECKSIIQKGITASESVLFMQLVHSFSIKGIILCIETFENKSEKCCNEELVRNLYALVYWFSFLLKHYILRSANLLIQFQKERIARSVEEV